MFFGPSLSTIGLIFAIVLGGTNTATWYYTDKAATEREQGKIVAAAYKAIDARQQHLSRVGKRAAARTGKTLSAKEMRADRMLAVYDIIRAYPGLKNCEVPAEVEEGLGAINN